MTSSSWREQPQAVAQNQGTDDCTFHRCVRLGTDESRSSRPTDSSSSRYRVTAASQPFRIISNISERRMFRTAPTAAKNTVRPARPSMCPAREPYVDHPSRRHRERAHRHSGPAARHREKSRHHQPGLRNSLSASGVCVRPQGVRKSSYQTTRWVRYHCHDHECRIQCESFQREFLITIHFESNSHSHLPLDLRVVTDYSS